ncbi:MAG: 6-phosphogluconolactonase, partial [Flavihumibacter sp.]
MNAGKLTVKTYATRLDMGAAAAQDVADAICSLLKGKETVNIIFAAAPSQNELLEALSKNAKVDWTKVNAFHMDEYIGLPEGAPQSFGYFLHSRLFGMLPFRKVFYIDGQAVDAEEECKRYAELLREYPVDIVCMGIGENGHIAFNDPHIARFDDPQMVKTVVLSAASRRQQVHDGCFPSFE